jgi:predicted metalloprotease
MRGKGRRQSANVEDRRKVGGKAIGDDTLQKQSQGYVVPDAFTHGTSEQWMR